MNCTEVRGLIPRYLDHELVEDRAAPLRAHLLSCPDCRADVQADKALEAWFVAPAPVAVPTGFAQRVARRAVAGDGGLLVPVPRSGAEADAQQDTSAGMPSAETAPAEIGPAEIAKAALEQERERVVSFLVSAVAVAALVLLSLAIALRRLEMPERAGMTADDSSKVQSLEVLRQMNEQEQGERDQDPGADR